MNELTKGLTMRSGTPEGYELVEGHSAKNARKALDLAAERELGPETVLRTERGYLVPLEAVPDPALPPANFDEARARYDEAHANDVEAREVEIPDAKTASHEDIDAFADEWGLNYEGIEAKNVEKPTRAEKVAHLTAALDALASANSEQAEATGELTGPENKED